MSKKYGFFGVLILCAVLTFSSCNFFTSYVDIDNITNELDTALCNEYGLSLTDCATIIKGHMDVAGQDPCIQLTFCISEDELINCLDDKWVTEESIGLEFVEGQPCEKSYYRPDQEGEYCRDAYIYHTRADDNGEILVLFYGSNPSMSWINS